MGAHDQSEKGPGIKLAAILNPQISENGFRYQYLTLKIDRSQRVVTMTVRGPEKMFRKRCRKF